MRDEYYRSLVNYAPNYDRTIELIKTNNPYAGETEEDKETFACDAVHSCIRMILYGSMGNSCMTGGCLAVRASTRPESPSYNKVILGLSLR